MQHAPNMDQPEDRRPIVLGRSRHDRLVAEA